jgi:hypothetical protein
MESPDVSEDPVAAFLDQNQDETTRKNSFPTVMSVFSCFFFRWRLPAQRGAA